MLKKVYLEITNICDLSCSFCHKTSRERRMLSEDEFRILTDKLRGRARSLYFHLMGEPTLHPKLASFIDISAEKGFAPILTTNGTLLSSVGEKLLRSRLKKVNISIHAPQANPAFADDGYIGSCIDHAVRAAERGCTVAFRLWNLETDADNTEVMGRLREAFGGEWTQCKDGRSFRLADRIFLERAVRFDWPDISLEPCDETADRFCYGLRDQIGVLSDGTVVPCCLDAEGTLALGNLFSEELDAILSSERAVKIYEGFSARRAVERLCRTCGYAERFSRQEAAPRKSAPGKQ